MAVKYEVNDVSELGSVTQAIGAFLRAHGVPEESLFDSKLVVSELVGNALKHARSKARLEVSVQREGVSLTVYSSGGFIPPETSACPSAFAEGGRGLFLVDTVAVERTVTEDGGIRVLIKL